MPPLPDYASPPLLWGREEHVRELFAGVATSFEFERHVNRIKWSSVEGWADFFMARFPVMVTARAMLGERFAKLREIIVEIWKNANEANDGSLRLPQEYLTVFRMRDNRRYSERLNIPSVFRDLQADARKRCSHTSTAFPHAE
jgi:hypothetical protein